MPYDIVDAYEDISALNEKYNLLIRKLMELKIIPEENRGETK